MDFGALAENIPLIVTVIGLILLQVFLKQKRKPETTRQEIAQNLLAEVKLNQALTKALSSRQKPRKFETVSWQRSKTKLDFLNQSLQSVLSNAFTIAEDFNQQLESVKKYESAAYLVNVSVDKLGEALDKSRQGLEEWLLSNTGTKEPPTQYPGILDGLLGKR